MASSPSSIASDDPHGRGGKRGALTEYLGYALRRAQLVVFADFIATLAALDLRPAEFSALAVIDARPGVRQTRIGETLGIRKANLVPLLAGLEARALVRRVALDGRSNGVHLTRAGRALLARAQALNDAVDARASAKLSAAERDTLLALLWRVAEAEPDAAVTRVRAAAPRSPSRSTVAPRRGSAAPRSRASSDPA